MRDAAVTTRRITHTRAAFQPASFLFSCDPAIVTSFFLSCAMSVPMSYSVWLKPAPDSAFGRQLSKLVASHAAELGTPPFAPHVTLLGGFNAESDVRTQIASRVALPAR